MPQTYCYLSEYVQLPNISEEVDLAAEEISFKWTEVVPDCPCVSYNILTSKCGSCPTTTHHTNATCTNIPTDHDGSVCAFTIQTLVCGNVLGHFSDAIHAVALKYKSNNDCNCNDPNIRQYPCNGIGRSVFTGAIVSAALLGGIASGCTTFLITVIIQRKRKVKNHTTCTEQVSPDRLYDDVIHKQPPQPESAFIDVRKNVAYGPVASAS